MIFRPMPVLEPFCSHVSVFVSCQQVFSRLSLPFIHSGACSDSNGIVPEMVPDMVWLVP